MRLISPLLSQSRLLEWNFVLPASLACQHLLFSAGMSIFLDNDSKCPEMAVLKRVKRNPGREVSHIQIAQAHIQTQVVTSQGVYEVRVKVQHTRPISPKNLIMINKIINK